MSGRGTMRMGGWRGAIAAAMLAGLAGCSSLAGPSALDTFDLSAPRVTAKGAMRPLQILVPEPTVDRSFDSDRIVVRPDATGIATLPGAQWSDRLPRLVQSRLVEALTASGRFRAVGRPGQGFAIDRQVLIDLAAFDWRPAEGRAVVEATVRLMDDRTGRALAVGRFRAEEPVAGDAAKAVVAGLDAAFGRVAAEIADFAAR